MFNQFIDKLLLIMSKFLDFIHFFIKSELFLEFQLDARALHFTFIYEANKASNT